MLSVVCPVYNEADNIRVVLEELCGKVSVPLDVLIVYDRDDDNTIPVVEKLSHDYKFSIKLVKNRLGPGPLNAIKTGFTAADSEAILVLMADLSDDLSIVDAMYDLVVNHGFDVVCGSRYMPGGRQRGGPRV